jgi:DNA-binding XRE family transcriptional regulator
MGAPQKNFRRRVNTMEEMMRKHHQTDHSLSELAGTTYQNVNRHKLGRAIPSLDLAYAYAVHLKTTVEDLFFPGGGFSWAGDSDAPSAAPCTVGRHVANTRSTATVQPRVIVTPLYRPQVPPRDNTPPSITDPCSKCGASLSTGHDRATRPAPHPNDWRRKLQEDEIALLLRIFETPQSNKSRVADSIRDLQMTKKRAFSILGAWADWGWYDPGSSIISGSLTQKGIETARSMKSRPVCNKVGAA